MRAVATMPTARSRRRFGWLWPVGTLALLGGCPYDAPPAEFFNNVVTPTAVVTAETPVFRSEPVFEQIPGKIGSHAPTITAFDDGELLAAWYSYAGPGELNGAAIYTSRRLAGASEWTRPTLHIDRPEADGNPVLHSEGDEVWMFQAVVPTAGWSAAHIEVQRSSDRGVTWSPPRLIPGPIGANVRFPPLRLSNGRLLLPAYDDLFLRSLMFSSADGERWELTVEIRTLTPHENLQPSVVQLATGRLLSVMRNAGGGWLWVAVSEDEGRTWSAPRDGGFPNPASPAALLRLASGNLILIFNDSECSRRPLSITISADEGLSWYPPRVLADGDGNYAYPGAAQTHDGLIHIVYSHDRARIQHITLNEAWIAATASAGRGTPIQQQRYSPSAPAQ